MEKLAEKNAINIAYAISKLVDTVEEEVGRNKATKECKELSVLKEKCCDENVTVCSIACSAVIKLVEHKVLAVPQTISFLISLLPSATHLNPLISAIGTVLLFDLRDQSVKNRTYLQHHFASKDVQNPFVIILKCNLNKSWFEIYSFVCNFIKEYSDIKVEYKINLLRPVFHHIFENQEWKETQFQIKLFECLMSKHNSPEYLSFALEILSYKKLDLQKCLYLKDMCSLLLNINSNDSKQILSALNPQLAESIKWIIQNGFNPSPWITLLKSTVRIDDSSLSIVLFILTDVILEAAPLYGVELTDICRSIICSASCNRFVACRFVAISLNWFTNPCSLASPMYEALEDILFFVEENHTDWRDQTDKLLKNNYFRGTTCDKADINFAAHLIRISNFWNNDSQLKILNWLANLQDSDEFRVQLKIHTFIYGIILCENSKEIIDACLKILFKLLESRKEISFTLLCLLFYKLTKETDPVMQKTYLSHLPKLAVTKDNIPLIIGILDSLKKGNGRIMEPLVVQLFLTLWKTDNRTYSYLHKLLHESSPENGDSHLNLSKAVALRELCRLAAHLHAKDVIGVLSRVLNECANDGGGLPSAIAIEAIIELCEAFVIDVTGTWNAIQPTLGVDKRPKVVIALCKFFGKIPELRSSGMKNEELVKNAVKTLWNYTFMEDREIVKNALRALSKYELENLNPDLVPEPYRVNDHSEDESISSSFVPPECWLKFLNSVDQELLNEGGNFLKAILERDLNSLPRGLFYLQPEKSEPSNYSYLPKRSVCRVFIEQLRRCSKIHSAQWPPCLGEIIRVVSLDYNKLLPPLNWEFMSTFMITGSDLSISTLALLIKQSSVSRSAKSIVEEYLAEMKWTEEKVEEIVHIYSKISYLCKAVSRNLLKNFLLKTLTLCVDFSICNSSNHFAIILGSLEKEIFTNECVTNDHKITVAECLENILSLIPPEHKVMKRFASCATEFPIKSIENITKVDFSGENLRESFLRAVEIKYSIAMRLDIKKPLSWFNELIDQLENLPVATDEKGILMENLMTIIRNRRDCDHSSWIQGLMYKIQNRDSSSDARKEVSQFLIDIFVSAIIVLSGYDSFFDNVKDLVNNKEEKLEIFPQSHNMLMKYSEWISIQSKITLWMQQLLQQNHLPGAYIKPFAECVLFSGDSHKNNYSQYRKLVLEQHVN